MKLALPELESTALELELADGARVVTSVIGAVETRRAVGAAATGTDPLDAVRAVLENATVIEVTEEIGEVAAEVQPWLLRSLDTIHLATVLSLGNELDAFVVYDRRLADAARSVGLPVRAPGRAEA